MGNNPIGYIEYILTSGHLGSKIFEDLCTLFLRNMPEYKDKNITQLGGTKDKGRDAIISFQDGKAVCQFSTEKGPFKNENSKFWREYSDRKKEKKWKEFIFVTPHRITNNEHDKILKLTNPSAKCFGFSEINAFLTTEPTGINFAKNNGIYADCSFYEHNLDPLRSCIKKMDKKLFENFIRDLLLIKDFISSEEKNLSFLYSNKSIDGYMTSGTIHQSIFYIYQMTTEFSFSDKDSIQKGEIREEGNLQRIFGKSIFIILSNNIQIPQYDIVKGFISSCINKKANNLVLFINEKITDYGGIHGTFGRALRELKVVGKVNLHILFLGEITYLLLTSNLYHKYGINVEWALKNKIINNTESE